MGNQKRSFRVDSLWASEVVEADILGPPDLGG